jgi:hypothetical protein
MAQEVLSHARLLQLTDTDFRMIEEREFSRKHLEFLYTRDVTEYSVCVHILANKLGLNDSLIAFSMCARLTRLVLNFPQIGFDRLAADCPVEDVLEIPKGHEFAQAIRDGLGARDLGTLYYLLCSALPANVSETGKLFDAAVDVALAKLGIEVKGLTEEIEMEAKKLITSFGASPIGYILQLASAGYENLKRTDFSLAELQFNQLNLPPVLLGDDSVTSLFDGKDNSLDKFDLEGCFFELDDGMSWVNRFSEGCI